MTTFTHIQRHHNGAGAVASIAIALVTGAAVLGLAISAVTFLAVGLAFALAVPIAQQYAVSFSATDMAVAGRIAGLWWVFGVISAASLLAAVIIAIKAVRHLGGAPRA